jgi:large subunit ribosomal protein L3
VTGKSIGKGFAGLQKRHNFGRGPMTHGSKNHRAPGSIGAGTTPGRVYPGKKMAGQLGAKQVTIKKLKVLIVDVENNLIIVKGAVPGKPGNLVTLQPYTFNTK